MSTMMQSPPPPPGPPPGPPPPQAGGHGPFSEEEIQEIMVETGNSYEQVCADIAQSGASTKEDLYPQFYSGAGIQPQPSPDGQMASAGAVEGQPPTQPVPMPQGGPGMAAPPPMAPPESGEGEAPQSAPMEAAEGEGRMGIDPRVAQAMHTAMKPKPSYRRMTK